MIQYKQGNLLQSEAEALVNTVNCVGVMGKGIALQFKLAFPANYRAYLKACRKGDMKMGQVMSESSGQLTNPLYIINFPTKKHWKSKSNLEDIRSGLVSLIAEVRRLGIASIAVPPLGCGNGGLEWLEVRPLIEAAFDELPDVQVLLFEPQESPDEQTMPVATQQPNMTRGRAAVINLLEHYHAISNELTLVAIQKLVYFLQVTGEPLKLNYGKGQYGPYSETLNHVLQNMEGHFIRGYGDRSRRPDLVILPQGVEESHHYLESMPEVNKRIERVLQLIEGFESGYGMELLATIHWVAHENFLAATDPEEAIRKVQQWSKRKSQRYKPEHISKAWQRLHDNGWLLDTSSHQSVDTVVAS
jgi:O-acetyl-ADP-ribose deacetylase (regulator of RNase III)